MLNYNIWSIFHRYIRLLTGVLEWQQQQIQQVTNNNVINQNSNYPEVSKPLTVGNCLVLQGSRFSHNSYNPGLVMIAPVITKSEQDESSDKLESDRKLNTSHKF